VWPAGSASSEGPNQGPPLTSMQGVVMNAVHVCCKPCVLLIPLLSLVAAVGCDEKNPKAVETPPPVVEVAQPVERTVTDYQVFTARTQAVQSVDLKARITGYLTKINFKDGDMVKEGEVLFQIDDRPYKAALDQAKGALDAAKGSLEVAKAAVVKNKGNYDVGLDVQKQDKGAISDQELIRRLGALDEAKASVAQATGSIAQATGALETAQLNFDWCKVKTPISGRATRHLVDVGNMVNQNVTNLVNVVSLKPVWAYIYVDQNTALRVQALVREGKIEAFRSGKVPANMSVGVGSDEKSFPFHGIIDYTSPELDPNTGTIQVRAEFPNEDETLVAGLFGRIQGPVSAPHAALLVLDQAIGTNQGRRFILIVNDKQEVEYRPVDVGQLHDSLREVKRFLTTTELGPDGKDVTVQHEVLKPTDRVIVNGLQRARPGDKVDPKLVDMQTLLRLPDLEKKPTTPAGQK
jgi:RND family efflux transporter MFP subunit